MRDLKYVRYFQINISFNLYFIFKLLYIYFKIISIQTNECLISNNTIITSQWLNYIICIGDSNYKYVNFANFSNGDMIVETTSMPALTKRYFYGIKQDGKPLFKDDQYDAYIEVTGQDNINIERNEGEIFIVPIENKDYLFYIGKGYVELYDLENYNLLFQESSTSFFNSNQIVSSLNFATSFKDDDDKIYFIFPFLEYKDEMTRTLKINKLYFSSADLANNNPVMETYSFDYDYLKPTSCLITESKYIMCLLISGILILIQIIMK